MKIQSRSIISRNKGLTLIEIIIALAIIGIIAVTFLSVFTFGFFQIAQAGNKSSATFLAQKAADVETAGGSATGATVTPVATELSILLPNMPTGITMNQSGTIITVDTENNGKSSSIKTFVP